MRKRSGALNSDTVEDFIKLAVLSQNVQNFFYTNDYVRAERQGHDKANSRAERRKNDFEESDVENKENIPYSWPPKGDSLSSQCIRGFRWNAKEKEKEIYFKENSSPRSENITTILHKIMVIGEGRCQMRNFIERLFDQHEGSQDRKQISNPEENFFDLIIKSVKNDETKNLFKFWIQNLLDNDKFKKIIEVYYKTVKLFIFVYDSSRGESFEKVKRIYQNLSETCSEISCNFILVDVNPEDSTFEKSVSAAEASYFVAENCFLAFLEMNESSYQTSLQELYSLILQFSH